MSKISVGAGPGLAFWLVATLSSSGTSVAQSFSPADSATELRLCRNGADAKEKLIHCSNVIAGTKNQLFLEIAHNTLGHALMELERFSDAAQHFSEVIKLNPNIAGYYDNRQGAYRQLKDFDLAMKDANRAIQLAPTYSFVYRSRANLFSDMGNFKDGIADFTRAIGISPLDGGLFIDRGKSFRSSQLYDQAIADFSHALEIDTKKWVAAYRERGLTYKQIGRLDLARSDLELYAQLWPQDQEVETALSEVRLSPSPNPTPTAAPIAVPTPIGGRRVALVIGNRNYANAALANPIFDADLVTSSLKKIGFEVTEVKNADFKAMDAAITNFVGKEDRPDIVLLYFAGHGFAINDGLRERNYLMSTSADLSATSEAVLRRDGMPLDEVIDRISAPANITLAFVDACRNDPFHRGAGDRGFERIDIPLHRQLFIGMSTQVGKTAIDGVEGMGSPFARAFAEVIATPGLRIDDAFRELRDRVARMTDDKQKPEILQDDLQRGAFVLTNPQ